jgi:rubrerythrin
MLRLAHPVWVRRDAAFRAVALHRVQEPGGEGADEGSMRCHSGHCGIVGHDESTKGAIMQALPSGFPSDLIGAFAVLKTRGRLAIDDLKVLAMIESAGELLYLNMAKTLSSAEAKKLLTRNGHEERGHAHRILKAIHILDGNSFDLPEHPDNPFVPGLPPEIPVSGEFLAMLEREEVDGDRQYNIWADGESNSEVAKLLRQNGAEECNHGRRVAEVKQMLNLN